MLPPAGNLRGFSLMLSFWVNTGLPVSLKACPHQAKAKISLIVCRLFFDLFRLFFDLFRFRVRCKQALRI